MSQSSLRSPLVAISVPSGDMVHADFAVALATLCLKPGAAVAIVNSKSSIVSIGRNQCVAAAQMINATHLLFLDSDMVFPKDTLARLLAHGRDIVGALYSKRVPPFHSLGVPYEGKATKAAGGLVRMKSLPTGCLLIDLRVFEKLSKPYFTTRIEGEKLLGEDYVFCEYAAAAGFELWCDEALSQEVGHIGQKIYKLAESGHD